MDDFTLLCFLQVAETGSFTTAAKRVNRTQSAVTQQIKKLEALLKTTLFLRTKSLALTEDGEVFLRYARQIFSLQREALDRFRQPELEGEVHFGVPEAFASVFLSDVLADFARIHPRILLNVECDLTLNLFERFKKNEFDLVLVKMSRPHDFPQGVEVWSESLAWVGNDEQLANGSMPASLPLALAPKPCVYRSKAIEALQAANISWRVVYTSPSFAGTIAAVKAGLGITVLAKNMIPDGLKPLRSDLLPPLGNIHISLLKQPSSSPASASLEDFLLKKLNR